MLLLYFPSRAPGCLVAWVLRFMFGDAEELELPLNCVLGLGDAAPTLETLVTSSAAGG